MLTIENCKLHPDSDELANIQCAPGTITVVLGRNQSGKTALCRLVAGLQSHASGDVTFTDRNGTLTTSPTRGRGQKSGPVAMVFQAFVNYPNWTVAQNIASPLIAGPLSGRKRQPKTDIDARVRELATLVKIDHLLERMPNELSGGQQQRLAIARALAKEPAVLVMDEPFVNIDFKLREALNTELRSLVDDTQVSLLFTTSDPADALALADHLLLLDRHTVLQQGKPLDLYLNPQNLAAANLLSDPAMNCVSPTSYVRPEHVKVLDNGEASGFSAHLRAIETNGADTYLHADVDLPDGAQEWVIKTSGIVKAEIDAPIRLGVDSRDLLSVAQ